MFTPLGLAMACLFLITWIMSGLLVAAISSGWVKGSTAMRRLPKYFGIILFWPLWILYIINKK